MFKQTSECLSHVSTAMSGPSCCRCSIASGWLRHGGLMCRNTNARAPPASGRAPPACGRRPSHGATPAHDFHRQRIASPNVRTSTRSLRTFCSFVKAFAWHWRAFCDRKAQRDRKPWCHGGHHSGEGPMEYHLPLPLDLPSPIDPASTPRSKREGRRLELNWLRGYTTSCREPLHRATLGAPSPGRDL